MTTLLVVVIAVLVLLLVFAYILYRPYNESKRKLAIVLVLGDIGHSPRMQYHSLSLANQAGMDVVLVGYPGSQPTKEIVESEHIKLRHIKPFASKFPIPYILYAACKLAFEGGQLLWVLLVETPRPKLLMVQTPPAIPTLMVASMVAFLRRSQLIVDFHNLAYTILAEKLGQRNILVRLSKMYEAFWASKCDFGLCVTHRMGGFLRDQWKVSHVVTCYDRPLKERFRGRVSTDERRVIYGKLRQEYGVQEDLTSSNVVTMVSSTSWTPDEDFMMLLPGLVEIDYLLRKDKMILVFFITGKGPCKEAFVRAFDDLRLTNVKLYTPWLAASDYPLLLGSVDMGISLHQSSSGLDLPMKVVDMLGAELPVMGRDFEAFGELADAAGVLTFNTSHDVVNLFTRLALEGERSVKLRSSMMDKARAWRQIDWNEQWSETVLPVIQSFSSQSYLTSVLEFNTLLRVATGDVPSSVPSVSFRARPGNRYFSTSVIMSASTESDDYLNTGGVQSVGILNQAKRQSAVNHKSVPDNLYLQGYGRQFGDKMTYSVGLSYGTGMLVGGTFGLLTGLQKGGATSKLRVNAVMNAMSTQGPALANQAAIITMYYVAFNGMVTWARGGKDDQWNAVGAGALSGALFKATSGSWVAVAKYSVASAAVFTVVDFAIRNNYV